MVNKKEKPMRSLERYLIENGSTEQGRLPIIDFTFRAVRNHRGVLQITIHPDNQSGDTVDYEVLGNKLIPVADTATGETDATIGTPR